MNTNGGTTDTRTRKFPRGYGRKFQRGRIWWVAYYRRGKEVRESTKSDDERKADRLLKVRHAEIHNNTWVGPQEERLTFEDLATGYIRDYELRGLRSLNDAARGHVKHLRAFFGLDRAVDITPARIRAYQADRRARSAAAATVNRETSGLRRMFTIAVRAGQLSRVPVFPDRLEESPPRQGFFEHAEYLAVRQHLPADYQDVLDFAYFSGWRKREITGLTWAEVDLSGGVIRLSPERSKTKAGRVLPLMYMENGKRHNLPLMDVLDRRRSVRRLDCRFVFHRNGQPIRDWRGAWATACARAGLAVMVESSRSRKPSCKPRLKPTKLFHDCRRTAVRNLVRAGVPDRVAMAITGHKTRSVFDRYNIVSENDLVTAGVKLAAYAAQQPTTPTVVPFQADRQDGQNADNPTSTQLAASL